MVFTLSLESFYLSYLKIFYGQLYSNCLKFFFLKKFKQSKIFKIGIVFLPKKIRKYTLNRSPHVNKKSREQFETRVYKSYIYLKPLIPLNRKSLLLFYFFLLKRVRNFNSLSFLKVKLKVFLSKYERVF